jgi:uncharacterized protein YciW
MPASDAQLALPTIDRLVVRPHIFNGTTIPTIRDTDLAERAGMSQPRNIRTTIKKLIDKGRIHIARQSCDMKATDSLTFQVEESVRLGSNGGQRTVKVNYLTEKAAVRAVIELETPKADELKDEITDVFYDYLHGQLGTGVSREEFQATIGALSALVQSNNTMMTRFMALYESTSLSKPSAPVTADPVAYHDFNERLQQTGALFRQVNPKTGVSQVRSRLRGVLGLQRLNMMTMDQLYIAYEALWRFAQDARAVLAARAEGDEFNANLPKG